MKNTKSTSALTFAVLLVVFYLTHRSQCSHLVSHSSSELKHWENTTNVLPLFNSLDSVLKFLQQPNYAGLQPTNKILYAFDSLCMSGNPFFSTTRRRVFIAVEGNHRTTMDILSKRLSKRIGASYLKNPPNCLAPYRMLLQNGTPLCKAFYDLGLYAIAHRVRMLWNQWGVIVRGYWLDQLIYALTRLEELPPPGSTVYNWPMDLLLPDLIFYIDVPHHIVFQNMSTRSPQSWKNRCLDICRNVKYATIHTISTISGMDQAIAEMEQIVVRELAPKFHIQFFDDGTRLKKEPMPSNFS